MKVVDCASEIFSEIGSPSDISVAAIAYWVRANIGHLNNLLFSNFAINSSYEIVDSDNEDTEIDINAVSVLKKLYMVHRYAVIIRSKISAIATDEIVEIQDQDTKVRKLDKNQIIKTISQEKKEEEASLNFLINAYRARNSAPTHVVGDDTVAGYYLDQYAPVRGLYR